MAKYYGIVSRTGAAAIANGFLTGENVKITHLAIGDGGGAYYEPTPEMTGLKKEVHRINAEVTMDDTSSNVFEVSGILPSNIGGFTVRELAAYDDKGRFIAICNVPDMPKVVMEEGADTEMDVGFLFAVSHSEVMTVTVDPTVIIATKKDVARAVTEHEGKSNPHPNSYYSKVESDAQLSNKANITPPIEHVLMGADPISVPSGIGGTFYKNSFSEVTINFSFGRPAGSGFANQFTVGMLPKGFLPNSEKKGTVQLTSSSKGLIVGVMYGRCCLVL